MLGSVLYMLANGAYTVSLENTLEEMGMVHLSVSAESRYHVYHKTISDG